VRDFSGQQIDRYRIIERLGMGGMAVVYKAYDTRLERDVALKLIRTGSIPPDQYDRLMKRFEREARILAQLNHPNIVKVLDYGKYQSLPYLVMDFLSGKTLKDFSKPLSVSEAAKMLAPIARALAHAHQRKILHRDVKPSNILISNRGEPMLADFGIAKILEAQEEGTLTGTGMGVGTPEYMSPEQILGKEVDARMDIYALGVVFYELLTGSKPFTADTPMATLLKQMNDPIPSPKAWIPDLPEEVELTLNKALAKQPHCRFSQMSEFEAVLNRFAYDHFALLDDTPYLMESDNGPTQSLLSGAEEETHDRLETPARQAVLKKSKTSQNKYQILVFLMLAGFIFVVGVGIIVGGLLVGRNVVFGEGNLDEPSTAEVTETLPNRELLSEDLLENVLATEGHVDAENTKILELDPDVIQLANHKLLEERAHWEMIQGDLITWLPSGEEVILGTWSSSQGEFLRLNFESGEFQNLSKYYANTEADHMLYPRAISSKGEYLAAVNYYDTDLFIWQTNELDPFLILSGNFGLGVFHQSPVLIQDNLMVLVMDDKLQIWDLDKREQLTVLDHSYDWDASLILVVSSEGTYIALGNVKTGEIKVWDLASHTLINSFQWHIGLNHLAFSPDETMLVSGIGTNYGRRDIIRVWDLKKGQLLNEIKKSNEDIHSMVFTLDSSVLVTGNGVGLIQFWNISDSSLIHSIDTGDENPIYLLSISPDGKNLLSVSYGGARLWAIK